MNRLTQYMKAKKAVREHLTLARVKLDRKELASSISHTINALSALLVSQNNVVSIAYERKPKAPAKPRRKKAKWSPGSPDPKQVAMDKFADAQVARAEVA